MTALREFVADLLDHEGAVVDPVEPDGLDVLVPERLRAVMGWPELAQLGFGATRPGGAIAIGLEGDWLNRFGGLIGDRGRFAERQLDLPEGITPPGSPERLLEHVLQLENAIWRLEDARPAWTSCLLLAFRYTATSDEKREGLVMFGINQTTGSILSGDLLAKLRLRLAETAEWRTPDPEIRRAAGAALRPEALTRRLGAAARLLVQEDLAPFLKAMRRRLDRDRARIHRYHDDLRRTALEKLAGLTSARGDKADADRKRETMRVAAIEREYAAKLDDLRHNYSLRVTIDWAQGLTFFAPVQRYTVLVKRRKGERRIDIDWHPTVRAIELPLVDFGAGVSRARFVCDEALHLTEAAGQVPCPACGKAWCRACAPSACPRCGAAA